MNSETLSFINRVAHSYTGHSEPIGSFAGVYESKEILKEFENPVLLSSCDGAGTKVLLANDREDYLHLGYDIVAMNVNDILARGGQPLFFLNYFAGNEQINDERFSRFIEGVAHGCHLSNCELVGGETANMGKVYENGKFDVCGFAVGVCERDRVLPHTDAISEGDVILGVASNGFHANGYTKLMDILEGTNLSLDDKFDNKKLKKFSIRKWLMMPTAIYVNSFIEILQSDIVIKAMANITGGGLNRNIRRVLPDYLDFRFHDDIEYKIVSELMKEIRKISGMSFEDMAGHFNNGVGMVAITKPEYKHTLIDDIHYHGERYVYELGVVTKKV